MLYASHRSRSEITPQTRRPRHHEEKNTRGQRCGWQSFCWYGLRALLWLLLLASAEALKLNPFSTSSPKTPPTRVAVLGGGFAGLTAARTLTDNPNTEVLLIDQREYFEYTPGILRAWVNPKCHRALVNPIRRLLRSKQAEFKRVPPGCACRVVEASSEEKPPLTFSIDDEDGTSLVSYECDYAILATGGELSPVSDDRQLPDGTIIARRRRLEEQVASVMDEATSALVVGGGLTGVEMAAELAEKLGPGTVTLAVGPRRRRRARLSAMRIAGRRRCVRLRAQGRGATRATAS